MPSDEAWAFFPAGHPDPELDPEFVHRLPEWLGEPDRWLLCRLYLNGMTEEAIAPILGISRQAVSKRKQKALNRLRLAMRR